MLSAFIFGIVPMLVLIAIVKIGQIIKQRQKR
jgi:hypothetical protein